MHKTPPYIFREIELERPSCERKSILQDHECKGRSTMEHVWIYAGKQIPDKWAVIRLCAYAHSVAPYAMNGILDKEKNQYLSLRHATIDDLKKYPKKNWLQLKTYLMEKYAPESERSAH